MEIILLERVEKLGQMGDVVKVKPGYARNFCCRRKRPFAPTRQIWKGSKPKSRSEKPTTLPGVPMPRPRLARWKALP